MLDKLKEKILKKPALIIIILIAIAVYAVKSGNVDVIKNLFNSEDAVVCVCDTCDCDCGCIDEDACACDDCECACGCGVKE